MHGVRKLYFPEIYLQFSSHVEMRKAVVKGSNFITPLLGLIPSDRLATDPRPPPNSGIASGAATVASSTA